MEINNSTISLLMSLNILNVILFIALFVILYYVIVLLKKLNKKEKIKEEKEKYDKEYIIPFNNIVINETTYIDLDEIVKIQENFIDTDNLSMTITYANGNEETITEHDIREYSLTKPITPYENKYLSYGFTIFVKDFIKWKSLRNSYIDNYGFRVNIKEYKNLLYNYCIKFIENGNVYDSRRE